MSRFTLTKMISTATVAITSILTGTYIHQGYQKSIKPSNFERVSSDLGIADCQQQESFLRMLHIGGDLEPLKMWQALNRIKGIEDPVKSYQKFVSLVKKSGADQNDSSKFNVKLFRKNFVKEGELSEEELGALLVYITQSTFGRKVGQERNELSTHSWMTEDNQRIYVDNARKLDLIDRIEPKQQEYAAIWIAGASRIGMLARLIDYYYMVKKHDITSSKVLVLAGARELWANIDGIEPTILAKLNQTYQTGANIDNIEVFVPVGEDDQRIEEGKKYLSYLAKSFNIELNGSEPFFQCYNKDSCPPGRFPGRIYPHYAESEGARLTESLMVQDLINTYHPPFNIHVTIVDTEANKYHRPTTASTAQDAAKQLASSIIKGDFGDQKELSILLVTNNPYIERQTIVTQREVNKILQESGLIDRGYKVKVEGTGFSCKQDVATIQSEFAALILEKWQDAHETVIPKISLENLLYQTRDNFSDIPPPPLEQVENISLIGFFQNLFDQYRP